MNRPTRNETLKEIRKRLREAFPGVSFSLRGGRGTGYGYATLYWTGGPSEHDVGKITEEYRTADFDGMRDCMIYEDSRKPSGVNWVSLHRHQPDREGYVCPSP